MVLLLRTKKMKKMKRTGMSFDGDLKVGHEGEKRAMKYLYERHHARAVFMIPGHYPWFDLVACFEKGKVRTIEVKVDIKEQQTGNIAIEYMHSGRLTGVLVSEADWYVVVLHNRILSMKKRDLVEYLNYHTFKTIDGGDNDLSTFFLIPSEMLEKERWIDLYWTGKKTKDESKKLHEI